MIGEGNSDKSLIQVSDIPPAGHVLLVLAHLSAAKPAESHSRDILFKNPLMRVT